MAIFKKVDDIDSETAMPDARVSTPQPSKQTNVSVIGPTMVFKGELSADEDLIIEGRVEGTIKHHNKHLTVGRTGRIKADIHANSVIVLGKLVGDIHSVGTVTLSKGSEVVGNICCGRIAMEDGSSFKGNIDMGEKREAAKAPTKQKHRDAVARENIRSVPRKTRSAS